MEKRSWLLLISFTIAMCYIVFMVSYFGGGVFNSKGSDQLSAGIATALVLPHFIALILGAIFNFIGWFFSMRGMALTGGILYSVSMLLFPLYFLFVLPSTVLYFVGFAKIKN
ncbi:MAG: hypothetical protein ACRCX2_09100 [Paraclostridium sp.]